MKIKSLFLGLTFSVSLHAADKYSNPVIDYSLPDPSIIKGEDGYFYLYATEDIRNLPIHRSKDLVNWEFLGTAFTDENRPDFEPNGGIWAPDILFYVCVGWRMDLWYRLCCVRSS